MAEAEPRGVFSRFPWIQLAFCVACLAMTGWSWMRYSYARDITSAELVRSMAIPKPSPDICPSAHGYVRVTGTVGRVSRHDNDGSVIALCCDYGPYACFHVWLPRDLPPPDSGEFSIKGRVRGPYGPDLFEPRDDAYPFIVDATSDRFHGASVAGLLVGAMGCFIFGLYLRRWLRERDSAA